MEIQYPQIPIYSYDKDLTYGLQVVLGSSSDHAAHSQYGIIHASSLGGCLLHDAWNSSTLQHEDWGNGEMPAFLGTAFEELLVRRIARGDWPYADLVEPPEENDDHQHHVNGLAYGLPTLKGHLDGILLMRDAAQHVTNQALLEIKLMSPWRYRDFMRGHIVKGKGVTPPGLEAEFPQYDTQIQVYMGLAGLPECVFVAGTSYGKQVEEYVPVTYCASRIAFDPQKFDKAMERAERLQDAIDRNSPPKCEHLRYCGDADE